MFWEVKVSVFDELLANNQSYAQSFNYGDLPAPPRRHIAIVTCMDARIDPISALGLDLGDAHVIRNAGGRITEDVIRSLVISQQLLGTREVAIIQHTKCGMLSFTNEQLRDKIRQDLNVDASGLDFLPFTSHEESLREDIRKLLGSGLLAKDTIITPAIYDVETGRIHKVEI